MKWALIPVGYTFEDWQTETNHPYDIPKGYSVIKGYFNPEGNICQWSQEPTGCNCILGCHLFASLIPVKEEKEESQEDVFELLREFVGGDDSERWQIAKSKFRITRI